MQVVNVGRAVMFRMTLPHSKPASFKRLPGLLRRELKASLALPRPYT